jgi:hypothetical protein
MIISSIRIRYLDVVEEHDIGGLKIVIQDINNEMANTQIITNARSFSSQGFIVNEDTQYFVSEPSLLTITANGFGDFAFKIASIDLGIEGLGVDNSTLKLIDGSIDYGVAFQTNPENEVYINLSTVDILSNQNITIDVTSIPVQAIIAMQKTLLYNNSPIVTVINPVYVCIDEVSKTHYQFGDYNNYSINIPHFMSDDYVQNLLEGQGK